MSHPYTHPIPPAPIHTPLTSAVWGHLSEYLGELDYKNSKHTRDQAASQLTGLRLFLNGLPPESPRVLGFLRHGVTVLKWKPITANHYRHTFAAFFDWAVQRGYCPRNPVTALPELPEARVTRPIFTEDLFRRFQKLAEGGVMHSLSTLAWFTGMRLSDACMITREQVSLPTRTLRFMPYKTRRYGRWVELPLNDELFALLSALHEHAPADQPYLIPEAARRYRSAEGGRGSSLSVEFARIVRQLPDAPAGLTFHCLRHTRATRMLNGENAVDVITAKNFLGLSSVDMLARYVKVSPHLTRRAMDA